ncbi:MAG: hypothetical protein OJF49_002224 [Ktedonobacterales bacterium]|nr:MAG: hypothetical protein OJF49_002224 [Ktedonobacterales bacterium]
MGGFHMMFAQAAYGLIFRSGRGVGGLISAPPQRRGWLFLLRHASVAGCFRRLVIAIGAS